MLTFHFSVQQRCKPWSQLLQERVVDSWASISANANGVNVQLVIMYKLLYNSRMKKPVQLHILSDLHLEKCKYAGRPPQDTDILVAAGDMGIGLAGLQWAASWGLPVIYVPGNHEFEGHDVETLTGKLHNEAAKHKDVHVLQKEMVYLHGVRFLGATLWTDFAYFGSHHQEQALTFAQRCMPEYATALHQGRLLKASDTQAWHEQERAWLDWALAQPYDAGSLLETVVVSHFAPHKNSVAPQYADQLLTAAFASHCDELLGRCAVWAHGHMHMSYDYDAHGTRVICNPRGYSREVHGSQPGFDGSKLIPVGAP